MSDSQIFEDFGLVYSEVDQMGNPVIRASYPDIENEVEKIIGLRSVPYGEEGEKKTMFSAYYIDYEHFGISMFKHFSTAKTLTGSSVACLTWVSQYIINPLILKPFLENLLHTLLRVKVDRNILKSMVEGIKQSQGILKISIKHSNTLMRFSARIIPTAELPEFFDELDRSLGKA